VPAVWWRAPARDWGHAPAVGNTAVLCRSRKSTKGASIEYYGPSYAEPILDT
jgi:hypothetical protein